MATVIKSGSEKKIEKESTRYKITCTDCNSDIEYCEAEIVEKRKSPFIFNVPDFF